MIAFAIVSHGWYHLSLAYTLPVCLCDCSPPFQAPFPLFWSSSISHSTRNKFSQLFWQVCSALLFFKMSVWLSLAVEFPTSPFSPYTLAGHLVNHCSPVSPLPPLSPFQVYLWSHHLQSYHDYLTVGELAWSFCGLDINFESKFVPFMHPNDPLSHSLSSFLVLN